MEIIYRCEWLKTVLVLNRIARIEIDLLESWFFLNQISMEKILVEHRTNPFNLRSRTQKKMFINGTSD